MRQASGRLQVVAQALADALIWLAVFWLPILLPIVVVALLVVWLVRRRSHTSPPPTPGAKGE
jgi:heme/copper-type cytochrome/quinol oxidase subunit 2